MAVSAASRRCACFVLGFIICNFFLPLGEVSVACCWTANHKMSEVRNVLNVVRPNGQVGVDSRITSKRPTKT